MFEPVSLLTTTSPVAPSPTVNRRVVVVFPLVPVTRATWRPALEVLEEPGVEAEPGPASGDGSLPPSEAARRRVDRARRRAASRVLTEVAWSEPIPKALARGAHAPLEATAP